MSVVNTQSSLFNNVDISYEIFKKLPLEKQLLMGMSDKRARKLTEAFLNSPEITKTGFVWSECVGRPDGHKWNKILGHLTHKTIKTRVYFSPKVLEVIAKMFPSWNAALSKMYHSPFTQDILNDFDDAPYSGNHLIKTCISFFEETDTFWDNIKKGLESGYSKGLQAALYRSQPDNDKHHELYFLLLKNNVITPFIALRNGYYYDWLSRNPKEIPQFLDFIFESWEAIYVESKKTFAGLTLSNLDMLISIVLGRAVGANFDISTNQSTLLKVLRNSFSCLYDSQNVDWVALERDLEAKPDKSKLDNRKLAAFYLARAWNLLQEEKVAEGSAYFDRYKKISGKSNPPMAAVCEAQIMFYSGEYYRALNYCAEILGYCKESERDNPLAAKILIADCIMAQGDYKAASGLYADCRYEDCLSPDVRVKLAHSYYCSGLPEKAVDCLKYATTSFPIRYLPIAGHIYLQTKCYQKAHEHYNRFIQNSTYVSPQILIEAAECDHHLGNYSSAISRFYSALDLQESPRAFYGLADSLLFNSQPEEAFGFFEKAFVNGYQTNECLKKMAFCQFRMGNYAAADKLYTHYFELNADQDTRLMQTYAAFCKHRLGNKSEADRLYQGCIVSKYFSQEEIFTGLAEHYLNFTEHLRIAKFFDSLESLKSDASCLAGANVGYGFGDYLRARIYHAEGLALGVPAEFFELAGKPEDYKLDNNCTIS